AHEALKLREIHTELMRTDEFAKRPDDFRTWMKEGEQRSQQLEDALRAFSKDAAAKPAPVDDAFAGLQANCTACHNVYRNVPQGSKKP
ncbi:MAG: cytochrome c, partial [Planctomycetes bacterium]|nr:cytochrome c [Planctomycetota bacterium]